MHGKQSHSSNFMNLLECLHDQSHVPSPHRLPYICVSRMRVKISVFKTKLVVLENTLPNFGKSIGLPSEANVLENLPKQFMGSSDVQLLDHLPTQFSGKSSIEIPFTNISVFFFISCHALIPSILGCPSAYGMNDANSNTFMLIYSHAYILT